ncbi:hypothetical protein J7E52_18345 [Bacillus sp. ISL-34]|uniref:hypothetical protein n=1 Tax=Bacillus sp. ISL-34 TaxID=2819121 RepID=UPI001BE9DA81|nr:hypothetical protein [Bacillus sp. ISL-34]MBT2648634.1 hypothetical protein [Bacillus sp. ISL-34]
MKIGVIGSKYLESISIHFPMLPKVQFISFQYDMWKKAIYPISVIEGPEDIFNDGIS